MTYAMEQFLVRDHSKLSLERNLGDAMSEIVRQMFPFHTAKRVQAEFGLTRYSAQNVVAGTAGAVVITQMLHARQRRHGDAWALWMALGTLLLGEEAEEYERREVLKLVQKAENARSLTEERHRRREALATRTAHALGAELGPLSERHRSPTG